MEKLELKHLSPYLPYELKCIVTDNNVKKIAYLSGIYVNGSCVFHDIIESDKGFSSVKPILRPLSDLNNELNDMTAMFSFNRVEKQTVDVVKNRIATNTLLYNDAFVLFENHFDIFGLIEKGLAIDINTLNLSTKN